ncbi:hypothetical protein C7M84_020738 [Penaeus vannamei]|uniref:EGF-like domain-containing protein n=1 Tax=Penaeus vannamei TaxID=6689 RepID=A0A3R7NLL2_PENVA|nr:hypothetical protein C7M84_020738 [Penaeus vannamei]
MCYPGFCGENADCQTQAHRPICSCPPGTTGNPTIKCSAMVVKEPPTLQPPMAEEKPLHPDSPIRPIAGSTTTLQPPLIEETVRPTPEPLPTRPPPPALVPALPIACENNDDCDVDNSCLNKLCYDACTLGICGDDAECETVDHRPVCLCPYGTSGDPQVGCKAMVAEMPVTISPIVEQSQVSDVPIHAIPGPSSTPQSPIAELPTTRPPEPPMPLPPAIPTPPPNPVGCESTDDCPYDNSCINRLCLDVCHPGLCGDSADCQTIGHRPLCVCPPGTTGNPTESCKAVATDRPTTFSPVTGAPGITPDHQILSSRNHRRSFLWMSGNAYRRPLVPPSPIPEISPTQPGDPIRPIAEPTSPGLPPVAELPTPRPTLPPVTQPPPPPTPGPLPVGCLLMNVHLITPA